MTDAWLGIDIGTQSLRAIALCDDGTVFGPVSVPLHSTRSPGRHEQDPNEWIHAARTAVAQLTRSLPAGIDIRALAVDGTSGTLVPVATDGAPVGAATMYDDQRGSSYLELVRDVGAEVWARMGYSMQSSWALPRLLSMRANSANRRFAHQPDVILSHLAARAVATDPSTALKTGADLDTIGWPEDVLLGLGIDPGELPPLVPSGTPVGTVAPAVAAELSLPHDVMLIAGATDGVAAQLAAGAVDPGSACTVLGTTLVLKTVASRRVGDPVSGIYSHRAPLADAWYPGGASNVGAGAIQTLLPGRDLAALTVAAAATTDIPISYPLTGRGERFPIVSDHAEGFWPRDPAEMTDLEVFRSIAFGVAFVERLAFDRLKDYGVPVERVITIGGGARNEWWLGVRATVLGRPVFVPGLPEGSLGMAVLAAAAQRETALSDAVRELVRPPRPIEPVPLNEAELERTYSLFTQHAAGMESP